MDDLSTTITSTSNIAITDTLKFFIGDHPAQQFECGTQHGGNFKCCGCGIHSNMMGDLAHMFQLPWRSLCDQQELVIKGKFGKQASNSKPFDSLRIAELRQELHAREIYDTDHCKDDLQKSLLISFKEFSVFQLYRSLIRFSPSPKCISTTTLS